MFTRLEKSVIAYAVVKNVALYFQKVKYSIKDVV